MYLLRIYSVKELNDLQRSIEAMRSTAVRLGYAADAVALTHVTMLLCLLITEREMMEVRESGG